MTFSDVIIAGGGVAGSTAATLLARKGFRITLVDKSRFPRVKVCGEGLMPAGVRILRTCGLADPVRPFARPFQGLWFRLNNQNFDLDFGDHEGWVVPREEFDAALLATAREQPGVEIHQATALLGFEASPEGIIAHTTNGPLKGRLLLVATGIRPTRSTARRRERGSRRIALRALVQGLQTRLDRVSIFAGDGFEAYVAPLAPDLARMTLLLSSDLETSRRDATGRFWELVERLARVYPEIEGHKQLLGGVEATFPVSVAHRACHGERVLALGDAGGCPDPISGQGMSLALRDAELAADLVGRLLPENRLSSRHLSAFSKARCRRLQSAQQLSSSLLFLLSRPRLAQRAASALGTKSNLREKLTAVALGIPPGVRFTNWLRFRLAIGR